MLAESTIARPYARAAFGFARDAGSLDAWSSALGRAAAVVEADEVRRLLGHPKVDDAQLLALFGDVLDASADDDGAGKAFREFLKVVMHFRRLPLLPEIAAQFETLRRASENRMKVSVTSAVEMQPDQIEKLEARLRERFGTDIEMETEVDADIIGGLIVRAGDKVIDASVRGRLADLGRQLVR